ncbi:SH2D5 [Bugula neritina]|uniref:SH2D5 n=1 Tax=Bugula neritina TaxID=10212 RepID=A0A7J7JEQ5_BUGNE|nr:SH2D5 [Bugula neritina]
MITAGAGLCMFELEYLGSYAAKKPEDWVQKDYIKKRIKAVQKKANLTVGKVPVLFTICAAGVKVTDRRGQVVLLANSLTQISYCSFVKEEKIFCFLSRESSRFEEVHQYVHLFTTSQSIVDELNEKIINAFSAANSQGSTTPTASNSVAADNKPKRTESCKVKREKEGINRSASLKFPDPNSLNEYTTPSIKHGDICKERKLHSPGSPGIPGDPNSSTGNKMLKHIVSTQVKLESNRGKNAESFSKTLLSVNERDRLYTPKSQQPIKQPNQSARRKSVQTVDQNSLHRKTGNANLRRSLSVETYATVQKTLQSPRVLITPATANDNLAYINDESSGSPDLPDSIYAALPQSHQGHQTMTHQPSALPPPVAFSDSTPNQNDLGASDAQQNYIDIDKPGTNNNNTDTMSFYSDNYVKASTLGCRSHKTQSPTITRRGQILECTVPTVVVRVE